MDNLSNDLRCECGHLFQDHSDMGDKYEPSLFCDAEGCYCISFEADEVQGFGQHPVTPIEIKSSVIV